MKKITAQASPLKKAANLDRKERLFEAALKLFSELGFHGVAVPKIAKEAGIATGSIYNYFESKEELVNQLFWYWKNQLKEYYLDEYPIDALIDHQFVFIWDRLHKYAHDHPLAFQFIEGHMHASYLNQDCLDLEEEVFEIGRMFVRAGQAKGLIRKADPQLLVGFFFGAFVQYFKDCRASRQKWNRASSLVIRDLCWAAMVKN